MNIAGRTAAPLLFKGRDFARTDTAAATGGSPPGR
jgi:uncharacterized protein with PIN domain